MVNGVGRASGGEGVSSGQEEHFVQRRYHYIRSRQASVSRFLKTSLCVALLPNYHCLKGIHRTWKCLFVVCSVLMLACFCLLVLFLINCISESQCSCVFDTYGI